MDILSASSRVSGDGPLDAAPMPERAMHVCSVPVQVLDYNAKWDTDSEVRD